MNVNRLNTNRAVFILCPGEIPLECPQRKTVWVWPNHFFFFCHFWNTVSHQPAKSFSEWHKYIPVPKTFLKTHRTYHCCGHTESSLKYDMNLTCSYNTFYKSCSTVDNHLPTSKKKAALEVRCVVNDTHSSYLYCITDFNIYSKAQC